MQEEDKEEEKIYKFDDKLDDAISVDDIKDMNKQMYGDQKESVSKPLVNKQKKRKLKERAKELQELSKSLDILKSDSDSDSSSDSSSSSSSSSNPSPKVVKSQKNVLEQKDKLEPSKVKSSGMKITQPKQMLKIKNPIEQYNEKKAEWGVPQNQLNKGHKYNKHENKQNEGDKKYVNQFAGLPKSKLSQKLKESIIDSHLNRVNPTKPLVKGVKVTPDYYASNSPTRSRRRNSHGNRAFSIKHKIDGQKLKSLMEEYRSQGFLL